MKKSSIILSTALFLVLFAGCGGSSTKVGKDQAPVATAQSVTMNEDSTKAITLAGTDADDDSLTYTIVTYPNHGTFANGIYSPIANYHGADSFTFKANDGKIDSTPATVSIIINEIQAYGRGGTHAVSIHTEVDNGNSAVYYPSDIASIPKTPLIFFLPGFQSQDHNDYQSLLTFIASHGYSVIYAKDYYGDPDTFIERFEKMLDANNDVLPYVDTTRIGVIGHSSGGGDTF